MPVLGIIAEYDPFHTGHAHHIEESRRLLGENTAVIVLMSGNFVQRGGCAVADKWTRAKLALMGGADLVLELPTPWCLSSAEGFARGGAALLSACGVVDVLSFGSECGAVGPLSRVAAALDAPNYPSLLARFLDEGVSFPAARQKAVETLLGPEAGLLSTPNNNLGVEYLRALSALHSPIRPMTIPRRGAAHNSLSSDLEASAPPFVSATQLRAYLRAGQLNLAAPYLLPKSRPLMEQAAANLPDLALMERGLLAKLRTMSASDWAAFPDSGAGEGLPRRLERAGRQCHSMEEFFSLVKTRRYPLARLRRLVLRAYLGLTAGVVPPSPPYLRVLGFNATGRTLLREMKSRATLPVLTKPAHAKALDASGRQLFQLEARCTDLYDLCLPSPPAPGREWTTGPIFSDREGTL